MNEHHSPLMNTFFVVLSTILGWISLVNAQYILSFILTLAGLVNVIMAIRYYYYAGNEKKKNAEEE